MSPLENVYWWAMGIAVVAILFGVCGQGRLKHWILVLLGEVPKETRPGPFGEIPRRERDWSMLVPLVDVEVAPSAEAVGDDADERNDDVAGDDADERNDDVAGDDADEGNDDIAGDDADERNDADGGNDTRSGWSGRIRELMRH
jgi:hypothetical protein